MDAEKKRMKGRFLYLFDWHAKPRKKLFPNNSQSSAGSNEWEENLDNSTVSGFLSREPRFGEDGYITKGSGNNTCTSSVNGDDVYGTRAPGVVARLMGLESLPTSGEASSVSSHDFDSAVGSSYYPRNVSNYQHDHHTVEYSYTANRLEGYNCNSVDSKLKMVRGRPIERFQEVLPPKSAKPISITHHKLLSPIKSPGFVPTNDAAYIMEAAARIIDSAPQANLLTRTPSFGSGPVSSPRIRDLRDKLEAEHRSNILIESSKKGKQSPSAKSVRGNLRDKLLNTPLSRSRTSDLEASGSRNTKKKGKGVSHAVSEKDSAQKKDGTTPSNSKRQMRKEHKQVKPKQSSNTQPTAKKSSRKTRNSASRTPEVLRLNSEKNNCTSNKDKANSMSSIPNEQLRRSVQTDGTVGSSKTLNKIMLTSENGSEKVISTVGSKKQPSLQKIENISRSKELVIKEKQFEGVNADNLFAKKSGTSLQAGTDNKEPMDAISFTFNSTLRKSACMPQSSNEMTRNKGFADYECYDINDQSRTKISSVLRLKLTNADALSLILEQKLKEVTDKVESTKSQPESTMDDTDACSIPSCSNLSSKTNAVRANSIGDEDWHNYHPYLAYEERYKREEIEDECSSINSNKFDTIREGLDQGHLNIRAPESSVSYGGCISSSSRSDYTYENAESFLYQSEEDISCASTEKFNPVEYERDISDTASSSYYEEWDGKHTSTSHSVSGNDWELQYMRQILHCGMLKEFVLEANTNFIDPSVFDLLEHLMNNSITNTEECTKLARKLLFDFVNDFLCLKYEQVLYGSYEAWSRWRLLLQKEDWLVEELFKEIIGLENLGNLVVDELVEKDMGIQYRGWLDFEIEMLEEGMEIEMDIVDSLIDELILDISSS